MSPLADDSRSDRYHARREELAERNRRLSVEADAEKRRDVVLTALQCLFWMAMGIALILWSFHTTDEAYGRAAFYSGIGVGNGGIIFSLLGLYRRGERRGDW